MELQPSKRKSIAKAQIVTWADNWNGDFLTGKQLIFCWKFQLDQSGPAEAKFGEIRFCLFTIFIDLQKYRLRYFKTAIMVCTSITLVLECIFSSCIISLNQIDVIKQSIRFWSIMIDYDIQRKWKQLNWLLLCKNSQIYVFFFRHQLGQESTLSNYQNIKLAKYT